MRTLVRILVAALVVLFCISALRALPALIVPVARFEQVMIQPWAYGTQFIGAPFASGSWASLFVMLAIVIMLGSVLRWAFGGRRRGARDEGAPANAEMEALARDLSYTARRLEERLEALETILLDRTRTPL